MHGADAHGRPSSAGLTGCLTADTQALLSRPRDGRTHAVPCRAVPAHLWRHVIERAKPRDRALQQVVDGQAKVCGSKE